MIISKQEQFSEFISRWNTEDLFMDVIYLDPEKHPNNNEISVIFVRFINDEKSYTLPFNHNDCSNLDAAYLRQLKDSETIKFCIDKKDILNGIGLHNLTDLKIRKYIETGNVLNKDTYDTKAHHHYRTTSPPNKLNGIIPILKHLESFDKLVFDLVKLTSLHHNTFYNDILPESLSFLESSGLYVNRDKFIGKIKHIDDDNLTYTNYNIFTLTGRPSNAFGGTNYAALGKADGSRQCFVSRFTDGVLYQFDYDAFHIRIVADLLRYELPSTSVHMWLAQQYFNVPEVTNEQYNESKQISFTNLYGSSVNDSETIDFFSRTYEFRRLLWASAQKNNMIKSPYTNRKILLENITDVSETKIFNYLLQLLETEHNISSIHSIMKYMNQLKSKMILYTYDSFLFDVHPDEIEHMKEIKSILEESGKYPVRVEKGLTYHSLS